jgi:hypothetical protein
MNLMTHMGVVQTLSGQRARTNLFPAMLVFFNGEVLLPNVWKLKFTFLATKDEKPVISNSELWLSQRTGQFEAMLGE